MEICDKNVCTGCAACFNMCNHHAIVMKKKQQGFLYPVVDEKKCVSCDLCRKTCPANACPLPHDYIDVFAALDKRDEERAKSTSGGIFAVLAKQVIRQGGYVYGAVLDNDLVVRHTEAHTYEEIDKFRKSKYLQSEIGLCYLQVKKRLLNGNTVLFSGTPCQISGLKKYLRKDYPNLLTVDILCHGVPSPEMFREYIRSEEQLSLSPLVNIQFRTKKIGWKENVTVREFASGQVADWADTFVPGFLSDYFLRESCYTCPYATEKRQGDITLGDYWGYKETPPEFIEDDDKGISLVIINSEKGKNAFRSIRREIAFAKRTMDDAKRGNPVLYKPSNKPDDYREFWKDVNQLGWDGLKGKYFIEQDSSDWMSKERREYYNQPFITRHKKHKLKCKKRKIRERLKRFGV